MIPNDVEKEPVSKWIQLKAMLVRNLLLKKRLGRKTVAVSETCFIAIHLFTNKCLNSIGMCGPFLVSHAFGCHQSPATQSQLPGDTPRIS